MSAQLNKVYNNPLCMIENRISTIHREGSALVSNLYTVCILKKKRLYYRTKSTLSEHYSFKNINLSYSTDAVKTM